MACPTTPVTSALSNMALAAGLLSCCGNTSSSWLASALGLRPSASLLILGSMMAALANCLLLSSKTLYAIKINKFIFKKKKDPTYLLLLSTCWGLAGEKLLFPRRMLTWVRVVSGKFALWLLPQRPRPLPWWKMSWPEPVLCLASVGMAETGHLGRGLGAPGEAWGRSCCNA